MNFLFPSVQFATGVAIAVIVLVAYLKWQVMIWLGALFAQASRLAE